MAVDATTNFDGMTVSAAVRGLARDVRRMLDDGGAQPYRIAEVVGRIDRLRAQIRHLPGAPLSQWLDGLQRQVEGLDAQRVAV